MPEPDFGPFTIIDPSAGKFIIDAGGITQDRPAQLRPDKSKLRQQQKEKPFKVEQLVNDRYFIEPSFAPLEVHFPKEVAQVSDQQSSNQNSETDFRFGILKKISADIIKSRPDSMKLLQMTKQLKQIPNLPYEPNGNIENRYAIKTNSRNENNRKVFVGAAPYLHEADWLKYFGYFGGVENVIRGKGYVIVTFYRADDARKCVEYEFHYFK